MRVAPFKVNAARGVDDVRIGALLLPAVGWPEFVRRAADVEAAGFDAVFTDDHITHPAHPQDPWLECWTALAGLAQHTRSITLGPLVSNIVLRHPALLTRQALTVAELSGGRLDLGIGSGYDAGDHAAVGEPVWSGPERSGRFADALAIVAAGVGDAVRLTVAGHGRRAIRLAATYGDTWVSYGGFRLPSDRALELTRRRVAMLEDAGGAGLGRRLLCGSAALTSEPIWRSVDAFEDFVGRYHAVGITEFAFHWPPANTNPEVDPAVVAEVTRRIASRPGRPGQDVRAVTSDANSAS